MEVAAIFLMFSLHLFRKCYAAELGTVSNSRYLRDGDTLVSATGIFELGFFNPGSSENRYLGIWYKNISVRTVVWVANRERPIPAGASTLVLKIADQGILVLFNNKSKIWSSDTTMNASRNATAKLQDSGNLVVMDQRQEKVLWQSFDYPTDTQLPGMKIGKDYLRGIEWRLSSWKSSQDPAPGEFTWAADTLGYPENKIKQGAVVKYRGGPWINRRFTGVALFNMTVNYAWVAVLNNMEVSFTYIVENSSLLTYTSLNSAGQLENWVWLKDAKIWQLSFSLPGNICDTYNICKAYGSCIASANMIKQSCTCLDEKRFVPRDQKGWDMDDWSGGCVRRTPLDCRNGSERFIKYSNVNLPDTESTWFNLSKSLEECETICLQNCTCMAYTYPDTSLPGRGCLIWFNDLIDIRVLPEGTVGRDIFVRMASSELAVQPVSRKKGRTNIKIILLVIFLGVLPIGFISTWFCYSRIKRNHVEEGEDMQLPLFSFSIIAKATANFSPENKLGEGGFGLVYKGLLEEGQEIAVKRLSKSSSQGLDEFKNEVICISKLQHRNLVKLLGCCIRGDEKLLIYEYMPNRSLDSNIFDKTQSMFLDWTKRFNIIKGIARGLVYLHQDSRLRIIHRDLKASNILLDQDMNPKISDFGIARSFVGNETTEANTERVVGTYGYMSPEYALDGIYSIKSDVFSFGVLVLEIVSGKKNRGFIQAELENNLIGYAWSLYTEGRSMELMDESLAKSCHLPEVLRSIKVGLLCVQQNASDRPDMPSVIIMLGGQVALPQPKQPAFFMERELPCAAFSSVTYTTSSINEFTITEVDAR